MTQSTNSLAAVAPFLLREGVIALRENSIMARLARFDVTKEFAQRGSTVNVKIPNVVPAQEVDVTTPNTPTPLAPTVVPVTLDFWYEATFDMSDRDFGDVTAGILPDTATEAIKSLANKVDRTLLELYKDIYGVFGSPGSTPGTLADVAGVRKVLNLQLAPMAERWLLIDPEADGKFLSQSEFVNVDKVGSSEALLRGSLGQKLGFGIFMDQNLSQHIKGTLDSSTVDAAAKAIYALGAKTITLDNAGGAGTLTGTLVKGDIFTLAGDNQTYVVSQDATAAGDEIIVTFEPGLKVATADGTLFTLMDSHVPNLAFNSQAFAFATRQLDAPQGLGTIVQSIVDPISGITLRLEISRSNKKVNYSYDILWGVKTIRRELAARLVG